MPDGNLLWVSEKLFDSVQKPHGIYAIMSLRFRYRETIVAECQEDRQSADISSIYTFTVLFGKFAISLPYLCHTFTPTACSCACIPRRVRMQVSKTADRSSENSC